ncbi:hypothetical protein [Rathayibacter sp. VKM Ac-2630]|uniref:hypothetical protein n=1 Tax=Rathayibacter sp. VKM Ac-2630 TaxID=1938617 RepID=UPI0009C92E08|nr:hypothetical protein [Rathayibacter sp. VKM Ac-2630]OOB89316.1 hypothetical protein B0T42_18200 [Rathayibacter sp. VKM Ac-2630]
MTQPQDGVLPRFAVGVDIGGTSIKASLVDVTTGERAARRFAVANPLGKEPEDFAAAIAGIVRDVSPIAGTPVGVGFPGIVRGASSGRPPTSRSAGSASTPRPCCPRRPESTWSS